MAAEEIFVSPRRLFNGVKSPAVRGRSGTVRTGQTSWAEVARDLAALKLTEGAASAGWIVNGRYRDSLPGDADDYTEIFGR